MKSLAASRLLAVVQTGEEWMDATQRRGVLGLWCSLFSYIILKRLEVTYGVQVTGKRASSFDELDKY